MYKESFFYFIGLVKTQVWGSLVKLNLGFELLLFYYIFNLGLFLNDMHKYTLYILKLLDRKIRMKKIIKKKFFY